MRCPKCHYISFDNGERCRNCGYDFSLAVDIAGPDLSMVEANAPEGPLADFALEGSRPAPPPAPDTSSDLPLFNRTFADRSRVSPPAAPRPPLAVRRATPPPRRGRARPEEPTLDLGMPDGGSNRRPDGSSSLDRHRTGDAAIASLLTRTAAGLLDATLIAAIHVGVIYLTLRLCGLTSAQLRMIPPVPLGAFLLLLACGYLISFTVAGGQTIGKMAAGIRVVPIPEQDRGDARVSLGCAVLRAAGCLVSVLTAGLGYVPALVSHDHRALHDRLAETRVVRA